MILGMGPDGHIGSLLPNSYALFDTDDLVTVVYQMEGGLDRITLTHPVMCAARQLLVMVSGKEKAEIVRNVLVDRPDEVKYPVHTLWPILHKVVWLIDQDAAKLL
jgi:6-phosphogluconolactonase